MFTVQTSLFTNKEICTILLTSYYSYVQHAELASTAATDVGMHGLLASQSCYHCVTP